MTVMVEGKGKYPEGMVQRAMANERPTDDHQRTEPPTQTKSSMRTRPDEVGSVGAESRTYSAGKETQSRTRSVGTAIDSQHLKDIEEQASGQSSQPGVKARKGKGDFLKGLISGTVISDSFILKDIRYSAMIVLLAIVFIANRFNAERMEREITALEQEVRDLRAESLSVSADLGSVSRQSEISDLVKERGLGLEELREPPYRIVVSE